MASMAAAIAAARTACTSGNPTLDEKERNRFAYFSSLNSMAKKIMQDKERTRQRYGPEGERVVQPRERDVVATNTHNRYALRRGVGGCHHCQGVSCCPILRTPTELKLGHSVEEEEKSQSLSGQDSPSKPKQTGPKQPQKTAEQNTQLTERPHENQIAKSTGKSMRTHEESAFRKMSLECSGNEVLQSQLSLINPGQIKPLEKGETPIPNYNIKGSFQKEKYFVKESEKPQVVTKQPKTTDHILTSFSQENDKPRPSQSTGSSKDAILLTQPETQVLSDANKEPDIDDYFSAEPQVFSQISTSNVILKTGFDFLDNW
ncbi:uncharacterized protein C1orf198 [Xenopus laevis]|uniref:Uncharacterized protein C1orf198 n=2 Tax=Xenopus laevis TaxID=8355 RepID=A0A1L8G819_XENLA|nr:uncharacterized protein C1orf198 [Xenopus laevis]OCT79906.1 hypothetical protein XELAEV_18026718mg [Xenopus laevis]